MTRIILLTAPRGAGKTTACLRFIERAREAGLQVGGVLTPARYDDSGGKTGFDAVNLATGEQRPMAWVETDEAKRTVGRFRFDAATLDWVVECALQSLCTPCDALVLDEIGPLELERKQGLAPALDAVPQARAKLVVLIVRDELAPMLQRLLCELQPTLITLTSDNRDQIPARLLEEAQSERCDCSDCGK